MVAQYIRLGVLDNRDGNVMPMIELTTTAS